MKRPFTVSWKPLLVLVTACDSGGHPPAIGGMPARLETEPVVTIVGTASHPLNKVVAATVLGGRIIIANAGSREVLFHDTGGKLVTAVGRDGSGPGEFRDISWMQDVDGRLLVYDGQLNRVSELSADGALVRVVNINPRDPYIMERPVGVFSDGTILILAAAKQTATRGEPVLYRDTFALLRYDPVTLSQDSVGSYVWTETYAERWGRGGQVYIERPLGRKSGIAVRGMRFYVVQNDDPTVAVFDASGSGLGRLRENAALERRRVSDADIAAVRERLSTRFPPGGDFRDLIDRVPIPDAYPPYGWYGARQLTLVRVDQAGAVWVLEAGGLGREPPAWTAVGADGSRETRVVADEELDILYTSEELALVLRWDHLDTEAVELRRIAWVPSGKGSGQ